MDLGLGCFGRECEGWLQVLIGFRAGVVIGNCSSLRAVTAFNGYFCLSVFHTDRFPVRLSVCLHAYRISVYMLGKEIAMIRNYK